MNKIKVFAFMLIISSLLFIGSITLASTAKIIQMQPAVVFVQDEIDRMLVRHNFEGDNNIYIPWDINIDDGFWIES